MTNPDVSAVRDADRIIGIIESEQKGPAKLIINRINPQMIQRGDMMDVNDVLDLLAVKLIGIVPEDEYVITSTNVGKPVVLDEKSKAGQAFRNIARRLMGDEVAFMDLEFKEDFLHRITTRVQSWRKLTWQIGYQNSPEENQALLKPRNA